MSKENKTTGLDSLQGINKMQQPALINSYGGISAMKPQSNQTPAAPATSQARTATPPAKK